MSEDARAPGTPVIQINHLKVAPENQDALLRHMTEQLDANIATQPGFISASLHKGHTGRDVVNYVLFETAGQLDAAHERGAFKAKSQEYQPLVENAGPVLYDIIARREREDVGTDDPVTRLALAAWQRMADGYRTGDFAPYLASITEDYQFRFPVKPYQEERSGRDEAAAYYAMIVKVGARMTFDPPRSVARSGSTVFVEYEDHGEIGGQPYRNRIVGVIEMRGAHVAAYREYFGQIDSKTIAKMEGGR